MEKKRGQKKRNRSREALMLLLTAMFLGCAVILAACGARGSEQTAPSETETSSEPSEPATQAPVATTQPATQPPTVPPTETEPEETVDADPSGLPREIRLVLVNPTHQVPEDWTVDLVQLVNGQAVDRRAYPSLQRMMDDCRADGLNPVIVSSYRTQDYQAGLYERRVQRWKNENPGCTEEEARNGAAFWVARPGTSEHQLGFAVDIVDNANWNLDESQESMPAQQWLMQNSWRYGWILRYPTDKSDITKIGYEPWHYRFVGEVAAREMHETGLCLEEYLGILD